MKSLQYQQKHIFPNEGKITTANRFYDVKLISVMQYAPPCGQTYILHPNLWSFLVTRVIESHKEEKVI